MKDRDELVGDILGSEDFYPDNEVAGAYIAVDATVYAVLEYIDDALEQSEGHPITQTVLKLVRRNISQLGRDV